jgi:hypothetical protein
MSLLDEAIMNFLPRHSLPFEFDKFDEGVTTYCYAATDKRSSLTTSGLGKIDHQRVPSLVLQMLICKFLSLKMYYIMQIVCKLSLSSLLFMYL